MIVKNVKLSVTWVSWALEITVIRQIDIFAVPDIQYNPTQLNIIQCFNSTVSVGPTGQNFNFRRSSSPKYDTISYQLHDNAVQNTNLRACSD